MNNKIEIFKLAIKAGEETFTEEQIQFLVECFKKAEQLSTVKVPIKKAHKPYDQKPKPHDQKPKSHDQKQKPLDGRALFIKQKLSEVKCNGCSYSENRKIALDAWKELPFEEKKLWNAKGGQKKEEKEFKLTDDDLVGGD